MLVGKSHLALTLFFITIAVWVLLEVRQSLQRRPEATQTDGGSRSFLRLTYIVGIILAISLSRSDRSLAIKPDDVVTWLGLALMWCGLTLRVWSFRTLGRYFTFTVQTSEDQPIITSGPYRVIRHPSYAALLILFTGWALEYDNWGSLIAVVVTITCGLVFRIKVEERALS